MASAALATWREDALDDRRLAMQQRDVEEVCATEAAVHELKRPLGSLAVLRTPLVCERPGGVRGDVQAQPLGVTSTVCYVLQSTFDMSSIKHDEENDGAGVKVLQQRVCMMPIVLDYYGPDAHTAAVPWRQCDVAGPCEHFALYTCAVASVARDDALPDNSLALCTRAGVVDVYDVVADDSGARPVHVRALRLPDGVVPEALAVRHNACVAADRSRGLFVWLEHEQWQPRLLHCFAEKCSVYSMTLTRQGECVAASEHGVLTLALRGDGDMREDTRAAVYLDVYRRAVQERQRAARVSEAAAVTPPEPEYTRVVRDGFFELRCWPSGVVYQQGESIVVDAWTDADGNAFEGCDVEHEASVMAVARYMDLVYVLDSHGSLHAYHADLSAQMLHTHRPHRLAWNAVQSRVDHNVQYVWRPYEAMRACHDRLAVLMTDGALLLLLPRAADHIEEPSPCCCACGDSPV